jgi:tellurite resistance protein TerC
VSPVEPGSAEETSGDLRHLPEESLVHVETWVWLVTVAVLVAVLAFDVFIIGRRPHEPSMRECAYAIVLFCALAGLFGLGVWYFSGGQFAGQFLAGWLTEYSLSIDNLFVFIIIMSRFAVPRPYQQTALLIGIILALVFRGLFIALGTAVIHYFSWAFYIFGIFLVYTAWALVRHRESDQAGYRENGVLRMVRSRLPATSEYHGVRLTVTKNGKRLITPMLVVMIALGSTDLLFALDSIPAVFGLTSEPYLVFTANVFALMGLRQLYFLLGGLLSRLVYLSLGLSFILAFIGVKLVLEALHENSLPFINSGHGVPVPTVPIWLSLGVIVATLLVTTLGSLVKARRDPDAIKRVPTRGV